MREPTPRNSFYGPPKNVPGLTAEFNPKAYTQAAQNPPKPKKLPTGPFIDHATDNYTGGMPLAQHLKRQAEIQVSRRTVRVLKVARWLVLAARIGQVLGSIALVVLIVSFRNMDNLMGWIMRIPPGVAALHALYSVYHHCRGAGERTPTSSTAYALFAAAMDCCIIPFFVFISLWTWQERQLMAQPNASNIWQSSFGLNDVVLGQKLVFSSFLLAASVGGLIVLTLLLHIYIAITFRRISKLPPDLNPLDKTFYTAMKAEADPKRFSKASTASNDSFLAKPQRSVPFLETRTKNGSLQWEYSRPADQPEVDLEFIPMAHKFDNDRRNSAGSLDLARNGTYDTYNSDKENDGREPMRERRATLRGTLSDRASVRSMNADNVSTHRNSMHQSRVDKPIPQPQSSKNSMYEINFNNPNGAPLASAYRIPQKAPTKGPIQPSHIISNDQPRSRRQSNASQRPTDQMQTPRQSFHDTRARRQSIGAQPTSYQQPLNDGSPRKSFNDTRSRGRSVDSQRQSQGQQQPIHNFSNPMRPTGHRQNTGSSIDNTQLYGQSFNQYSSVNANTNTVPRLPIPHSRNTSVDQPLLGNNFNSNNNNPLNSYYPPSASKNMSTVVYSPVNSSPQQQQQHQPQYQTPPHARDTQSETYSTPLTASHSLRSVRSIIDNANKIAAMSQQTGAYSKSPKSTIPQTPTTDKNEKELKKSARKKKTYGDVVGSPNDEKKRQEDSEGKGRVVSSGADVSQTLTSLNAAGNGLTGKVGKGTWRFRNVSGNGVV